MTKDAGWSNHATKQEIKRLFDALSLSSNGDLRTITVRMPSALHAALLEKSHRGASINQFCILSILESLAKEQQG